MTTSTPRKVAIVGAGPVGALSALYFSHAGWDVQLFEMRSGMYLISSRAPHINLIPHPHQAKN
jgi:2-polyprenyl-6-methoxyphenol hydroxylase-like FAD-dependent oxidoreductase